MQRAYFFNLVLDIAPRSWFIIKKKGERSESMKIGEVEKITGLTAKAIRLYEKKKLLSVDRTGSDYRDYNEDDVKQLLTIKNFRLTGMGLSQIKLWTDGIVSSEELIKQRMSEIDRENEASEEMYRLCKKLLSDSTVTDKEPSFFDECEQKSAKEYVGKLYLGMDIGTTTISASVSDGFGKQIEAYNIPNCSAVQTDASFAKEQGAEVIAEKTVKMVESLLGIYPEISAIGFSGQMHGIVYADECGNAVSNLITWQDERGNEYISDKTTYAEEMSRVSGYKLSTGFGLVSHFYNVKNGLVPKNAVKICTIMDYVAMKLCGRNTPLVHLSNAASFGVFDVKNGCFDKAALEKCGICVDILPEITEESTISGYYNEIPVSVAIGDNQASFLGSVSDYDASVLVNYGTGSQISFVSEYIQTHGETELRPFVDGKYLVCGAALCGGRAYAILESFFSSFIAEAGFDKKKQYSTINRLALDEINKEPCNLPTVDTTFCGTRTNPSAKGSVLSLDESNFTPSKLIAATLYGMANELYGMYKDVRSPDFSRLVASGNGVRKNEALRIVLSKVFGVTPEIPDIKEEAAYGAAKFARKCVERM